MNEEADISKDSVISLREINKENLRSVLRLKVSPEQERFVASNAVSIAQAYFDRDSAWFRAIYAAEMPVGFVMLSVLPAQAEYFLWRFMLDARYQRHGFGQRAIKLILEHVLSQPNATELAVSCVLGDGSPRAFYERAGFISTGEMDGEELILKYALE
jgi:diamine N-acetyltransferase